MIEITVEEKLNTVFGITLLANTDKIISAGDKITDGDSIYTVKRIIMPTRPVEDNRIAIIVELSV